jgi:hypothetical protein
MREILGILIALLSFPAIGESIIGAFRLDLAELSKPERFVVAFGLGNGAVTIELFLWSLLDLPLSLWTLSAGWIALGGISIFRWWTQKDKRSLDSLCCIKPGVFLPSWLLGKHHWEWWKLATTIIFALALFDLLIISLTTPFLYADDIAFWTPKAKMFFVHRSSPFAAFGDLHKFFQPDYPLFVPLTETWIFLWLGKISEYLMKLVFAVYAILLVLSTYVFIKRLSGQKAGLIAALALATTPTFIFQGTVGYADIPLALYYWLATILVFIWLQKRAGALLILGAVFLGLTAWIKNEGIPLIILNIFVFTLCLWKRRKTSSGIWHAAALFVGVVLMIFLPWALTRRWLSLSSDLMLPPLSALPALLHRRLWIIAKTFGGELFTRSLGIPAWNLAWYFLAGILIIRARSLWQSRMRDVLPLIGGQVLIYVLVFITTRYNVAFMINASRERLLIHFYPFVCWIFGWFFETTYQKSRA